MRTALTFVVIFLAITGAATLMLQLFDYRLLNLDYWNFHGYWLLIFLAVFPRLTLLVSSIPFGGIFWWLGFIFAPRYLVAILATVNFWPTNWFLVTMSWLIAIGGESSEKYYVHRKVRQHNTITIK